jgi:hypothetical protein
MNILSLDTSKESTRKKRKRAAWDENYLLNCLAAIIRDTVALGGARGTEVGREGGVVSFDVGGHVLATGGEAVNVYASIPTHRYVHR